MKTALLFLTTGFEEIEALSPVDVLRRACVDVKTVSLEADRTVLSAHHVPVTADLLFEEIEDKEVDALILPGGTERINSHEKLKIKLKQAAQNSNTLLAAICAAPMVFGELGLLQGKKAISYPGYEKYLHGAQLVKQKVVEDGVYITANGPAAAIDFSLKLTERLAGLEHCQEVAKILFAEE